MLRSMIIGLAIAAMLQFGTRIAASSDVSLAAQRIDWVQLQTKALARIVCDGYSFFVH